MQNIQELKETIQAKSNELSAAYNAHDNKSIAAVYDKNAILVAPGIVPAKGPEAISQVFTTLWRDLSDLELITDDVRSLDEDHAVEHGHATYMAKSDKEIQVKVNSNYVVVWEKGAHGGWHIISDIFNEGPHH